MLKRTYWFNRLLFVPAFCGLLLLCQAFITQPKLTDLIALQSAAAPIKAKTFYIAGVMDERRTTNAIAQLAVEGGSAGAEPVDLQAGTPAALRTFIQHNVTGENRLRPIIVTVKELKIAEKTLPNSRAEGSVSLWLSFGIQRTDDTVHLIDYRGGMRYSRFLHNRQVVEPYLRQSLMNGLNYFNNWMNMQAEGNVLLATGVKLNLTDYNKADEDTIYYNANRPLNWADFREKAPGSHYTAEVFPGLGFDEHVAVVNGIINLDVALKVYLPKSACWVKYDSRYSEVLNHEQRHFDIVKIISERYKQHLLHTALPPENYDGALHAAYFEYMHEMNVMQDSYDSETSHGQNNTEQEKWNKKISAELFTYGVTPQSK